MTRFRVERYCWNNSLSLRLGLGLTVIVRVEVNRVR